MENVPSNLYHIHKKDRDVELMKILVSIITDTTKHMDCGSNGDDMTYYNSSGGTLRTEAKRKLFELVKKIVTY